MPNESSTVSLRSFLSALLVASEKAANIARCCRAEEALFSLLVQEKTGKNWPDFKTLADVLVQEVIRHDLCKQFPGIGQRVQGEESNLFTNTLGETICVQVLSSESDTAALLSKVLDGNKGVASLLAKAVYQDASSSDDLSTVEGDLDLTNIGIWIDPIDSTSEYIHGNREEPDSNGLVRSGLQCACVLIGAYETVHGAPQIGVVNQPFSSWDDTQKHWTGRYFWGVSTPFLACHSSLTNNSEVEGTTTPVWRPQLTVLVSSSESSSLVSRLRERYRVLQVAGAGYKVLAVARGLADLYLLSKGSTYRWDTCGPHSLLKSLKSDGGLVSFKQVMEADDLSVEGLSALQLTYHRGDKGGGAGANQWCNSEGFLAYNCAEALMELIEFLRGSTDQYSEMEETAL